MFKSKLEGTSLYLSDPVNANAKLLSEEANKLFKNNYKINYKTYDKEEEYLKKYIFFDIKTDITKENIIIKQIKYENNLELTLNQKTNEVIIHNLPTYQDIPIFTSDILSIIKEKINSTKIEFENPFLKFALDEMVDIKSINIDRMKKIFQRIDKEEEIIKEEVLAEKRKKDRLEKIKKEEIAKKSIIYGVDKRDFEDDKSYIKAVNKKLVEVANYKIKNIKRHIKANKDIYINTLMPYLMNTKEDILEGRTSFDDFFGEDYYNKEVRNNLENYLKGKNIKRLKKETIAKKFAEILFEYDSNNKNENSFISLLEKEREERFWVPEDEFEYDNLTINSWSMYYYLRSERVYEGCDRIVPEDYKSPFYDKERYSDKYIVDIKDFRKCVSALLQINSLKGKLEYYEKIKKSPNKALLNFSTNETTWNSILNFPYFLRLGRDTFREDNKELIHLLMIRPNIEEVDFDNLRVFVADNAKEFGKTKKERQAFLKNGIDDILEKKAHRMIVTIPKTLSYKSTKEVIDYVHSHGRQILFVCENQDKQTQVKEILFDNAIKAYNKKEKSTSTYKAHGKEGVGYTDTYEQIGTYFGEKQLGYYFNFHPYFICVDPNYFENFMLDTPNNKVFYHRYDYTGNYPFRKKEVASFDYIFDRALEESNSQEEVSKKVLGSYEENGETLKIEPFEFMTGCEYFDFPIYSVDGEIVEGYESEEIQNPPENLGKGLDNRWDVKSMKRN